jgi:hypothetical protein
MMVDTLVRSDSPPATIYTKDALKRPGMCVCACAARPFPIHNDT